MSKHWKKDTRNQKQETDIESIGNYLQKLRTEKGLSIQDVVEASPISATNLKAIEAQDFKSLPADTFTRGLVTIYADFLGADSTYILNRFLRARDAALPSGHRSKTGQPQKILMPKTLAEPYRISSATMAAIFLVLIMILFTTFCVYTSWNPFTSFMNKTNRFQNVMMDVLNDNPTGSIQNDTKNKDIQPATEESTATLNPDAQRADSGGKPTEMPRPSQINKSSQ